MTWIEPAGIDCPAVGAEILSVALAGRAAAGFNAAAESEPTAEGDGELAGLAAAEVGAAAGGAEVGADGVAVVQPSRLQTINPTTDVARRSRRQNQRIAIHSRLGSGPLACMSHDGVAQGE